MNLLQFVVLLELVDFESVRVVNLDDFLYINRVLRCRRKCIVWSIHRLDSFNLWIAVLEDLWDVYWLGASIHVCLSWIVNELLTFFDFSQDFAEVKSIRIRDSDFVVWTALFDQFQAMKVRWWRGLMHSSALSQSCTVIKWLRLLMLPCWWGITVKRVLLLRDLSLHRRKLLDMLGSRKR